MKFKYLLLFSIIKSTNLINSNKNHEETIYQEIINYNFSYYISITNPIKTIKNNTNNYQDIIFTQKIKKYKIKKNYFKKNLGQPIKLLNADGQIIKEINNRRINKLLNQGFKIV